MKLPRIALWIAACCLVSLGTVMADEQDPAPDLPTEPVKYEMRIGSIDLTCSRGSMNDDFDSESRTLDATVTFEEPTAGLYNPEIGDIVIVETKAKWVGAILKGGERDISFENQRAVDLTTTQLSKHGGSTTALVIDRVVAKYVRGTIHGSVHKTIHVATWLQELVSCTGEGTLIMLPKQ